MLAVLNVLSGVIGLYVFFGLSLFWSPLSLVSALFGLWYLWSLCYRLCSLWQFA